MVGNQLATSSTAWSIGVLGALAEFERDANESAACSAVSVVTARGAIGLDAHPRMRAIAYEMPSSRVDSWLHGIALCLPRSACRLHARTTITEVGPDADALRPQDRGAILFDLGFGADCFDFHVRCHDPAQVGMLRGAAGKRLLDEPGLFAEIVEMSPPRVFVSALGRIEVYQRIGAHGGATPDGPHTHVLPKMLRSGRSQSANLPVPRDWVVCATLYPAHPVRDREGLQKAFDPAQHDAFQSLLQIYGDTDCLAVKHAVWRAVRSARMPDALDVPRGRHARLAQRVALRQMAYTDGALPQLGQWRARFDPPSRASAR